MEMALSQTDAARRFNVSRTVVWRLWDQFQSEDFVSISHVLTKSYKSWRKPYSSSFDPKEKMHFWATAPCSPLCTFREKNLLDYDVKRSSHCRSLCNATNSMCQPQLTIEKDPFMWYKRIRYLDQIIIDFCTLPRLVQIYTGKGLRASSDVEGTID